MKAAAGEINVEVEGVTVSYPNGHVALRDASFQLRGGSICALVGVNGSGKSTLFKAIMGLVAPAAGTVIPAPDLPKPPGDNDGRLPTWSGNLLRPENKGAFLKPPAIFCQIGNPQQWEAEIVVDQDDVEFVKDGQKVEIKLDLLPYRTFDSTIIDVGPAMEYASPQLSSKGGGDVMTKADPAGRDRPIFTSFQARAAIDDESENSVC